MPTATSFLGDGDVWRALRQLAARPKRGPAYVAVPWVGKSAAQILSLRAGDHLAVDTSLLSLRSGQTAPEALRSYLQSGVNVYSAPNPPLSHAKVYVFDRIAIVGSANISTHSSEQLMEAALRTSVPSAVRAARDFVVGLCREYGRIELDGIAALQKEYREPKFPNQAPRGPQGIWPQTGPTPRLRVQGWAYGEHSQADQEFVAKSRAKVRRAAGGRSETTIEANGWDPTIKKGDFVIYVGPMNQAAETWEVWPPAEVVGVPSNQQHEVMWCASPRDQAPIPWGDFRRTAAEKGLALEAAFTRDRWVTRIETRHLIAGLWSSAHRPN